MKSINILLTVTLFVATSLTAQQRDIKELDSYFTTLGSNNKFMGSVAISHQGKVIYKNAIGFVDQESGTKLTTDSKFRIGSISKTFTAALIFKAVEEGKLSLSDLLSKYYPEVPNSDQITVAHLLGHRSGIRNFTADPDYTQWSTAPKTEADMLSIIVKGGSDFTPDTKADYSNSNYVLLTYILQDIYKKPYATLIREKITKPLNLTDTYYGDNINPSNNEAESYRFFGTWQKQPQTAMSIPSGAGALVSTPSNLTRFIEALFDGKVVSKESLAQMKTMRDHYGMGLFQMPFNDKIGYGHTGGIDGFSSFLVHIPADDVSVAITSNGSNFDNNDVAIAALKWFYNEPVDIPEFSAAYHYSADELVQYTGLYSSPDMPLKITITAQGTTLLAQATGQSAFPLEATSRHKFKFDLAGIVLEFAPEAKQMALKQGGGVYTFTKQ